ncbi:MAG TPA: T9SS type A sorting domain-containing protein [Chitinophagales bacterium]|nr:T9SS type A sorting domain-containing protein [Chitinophagales bacterium]
MQKILLIILISCISENVFSQTPDWSTSIATILYTNCSTCHHDGGIAPFPLMTYNDAVLNGFSIQADVNASKMPPWPPDPSYSHFRDERVLADSEISQINSWVDGGMPLGDSTLAPQPPVFTSTVIMQNPDDTLILPSFTLTANSDVYRCFAVHSDYAEAKYLNEVEVIPGNSAIVHHLFLFHDTSDISYQHDLDDPLPGFYGGFLDGFSPFAVLDVGWTPGSTIFSLPPDMGIEVPAGSDFIVSIHYAPGHIGETDSTKVYLKWSDNPNVRTITNYRLLHWHVPSLLNPPFEIPANEVKTFYEQSTIFPQDKSLVALQPHMHLIGTSFEVFMVTAQGDTTGLLYIPQWNFYWQLGYFVTKLIKIPEGAQIFGTAVFDNTTNNPNNPSNPPINVAAGESTFDEMMSCRFWMMNYQPGDENILLDSSVYTSWDHPNQLSNLQVEIFPNPVDHSFHFVTSLPEHHMKWTLSNQLGMCARSGVGKNIPDGIYSREVVVSDLPAGLYILTVQSGMQRAVSKVMIEK